MISALRELLGRRAWKAERERKIQSDIRVVRELLKIQAHRDKLEHVDCKECKDLQGPLERLLAPILKVLND